jgi:Damage-control phosphatase ARMT1-like domain
MQFSRSNQAVFELSTRFAEPFQHEPGATREEKLKAKQLIFHELTQICLWGNATDLSLLINMTEDDIRNLQSTGGEHLADTEKNILGNQMDKIWNLLGKMKNGRLDFVLDNAVSKASEGARAQNALTDARSLLSLTGLRALLRHGLRRLADPERYRKRDPFPRKAFRLVRLGRYQEGL